MNSDLEFCIYHGSQRAGDKAEENEDLHVGAGSGIDVEEKSMLVPFQTSRLYTKSLAEYAACCDEHPPSESVI